MEKTWRRFMRPVLVLLVVGVIIGLGCLYARVDEGNINAESQDDVPNVDTLPDTDIDENVPDIEVPGVLPETVPDEVLPEIDVDTSVALGRCTLHAVEDMGRGYMVITGDEGSTHLRYVENGIIRGVLDVNGEYMTSRVGRYGLALVVKNDKGILATTYDSTLELIDSYPLPMATGYVGILDGDDLTLCYESTTGVDIDIMGEEYVNNSILTIDNISPLIATYSTGYGDTFLVFEDGLVVNTLNNMWRTRVYLGYEIADIVPIILDDRIGYAVLDKGDITRNIHILDGRFNTHIAHETSGESVFFTDRLYTIDRVGHALDKYCTCGKHDERLTSNVYEVTFVDYITHWLYYTDEKGTAYKCTFDDMKMAIELTDTVRYVTHEFSIVGDRELRIIFN